MAEESKKKKGGCFKSILIAVVILVALGAIFGSKDDDRNAPAADQQQTSDVGTTETPQEPEATPEAEPEAPATIAVDVQLSAGHYTAGIDIPAGTYDLTAVSGGGNVSSSNPFDGGINAIMGTADKNTDGLEMYEQEYKNIKLDQGVVLSIGGDAVIQLTCDAADGSELTPREQTITEAVSLGGGNYVAGTDFPAGVYDISATSGTGNVSSDNMFDGGVNEIMGDGSDGFSIPTFLHADFPEGTTLTISGCQITLTPSK